MSPDHPWFSALETSESDAVRRLFTCFYGNADNIVFPPRLATIEGATNLLLPGTPHVAMIYHPDVMRAVWARLKHDGPEGRSTCVPSTSNSGSDCTRR